MATRLFDDDGLYCGPEAHDSEDWAGSSAYSGGLAGPVPHRSGRRGLPRCPKCRQPPIEYKELTTGAVVWEVNAEGYPTEIIDEVQGDVEYVRALCSCGHEWRLRGIRQITDVRDLLCFPRAS